MSTQCTCQPIGRSTFAFALCVVALATSTLGLIRNSGMQFGPTDVNSRARPTESVLDLGLSSGTKLVLNIGSNVDPILPRLPVDDICTFVIAFEPVVYERIPSHPALHVLPAAVSSFDGLSSMHLYNKNGASSSFSTPRKTGQRWNSGKRDQGIKVVPVLSMLTVMNSLDNYEVGFIKTDMQGFDFKAISSVKPESWKTTFKVPHMKTEVYLDNLSTYVGVSNDLCNDWLPYMKEAGYIFEGLSSPVDGYESQDALEITCLNRKRVTDIANETMKENDALWRHFAIPSANNLSLTYDYPLLKKDLDPDFFHSEEEYAKCYQRKPK